MYSTAPEQLLSYISEQDVRNIPQIFRPWKPTEHALDTVYVVSATEQLLSYISEQDVRNVPQICRTWGLARRGVKDFRTEDLGTIFLRAFCLFFINLMRFFWVQMTPPPSPG